MLHHYVAAILVLVVCPAALAQDSWVLTTSDFRSESVVLKSIDSSALKVKSPSGEQRSVPMDRFLDIRRTLPAAPTSGKFVLHMVGGDQLGGEPVALKAESLVWRNTALGEIEIPTSRLAGITPPGVPGPVERGHEDVVSLSNGDAVRGIIAAMSDQKITVQTPSGNTDAPLSSVAAVTFAATPRGAASERGIRVRFDDGSSLVSLDAKLDGGSLVVMFGRGAQRKIPLGHVTALEQVNGPVSWLSARAPSQAVYQPFIGPPKEPAAYMDRSWRGERPISFKDRTFAHGIGVHAYSRLSWPLDGKYAWFRTRYAVDGDSTLADVTVRVKLDDKVVYEQKDVRAGVLSPLIVQDLNGAKKLTLEVDGGAAYTQDSLDWIEPALLRDKPAAQPPATMPDDAR